MTKANLELRVRIYSSKIPFPLFELFNLSFHRGDLTFELDALGVGATFAAAIRFRRSIRGGDSRPGLGSLACSLVESRLGINSFDFCGTTHRARAEDLTFPDLEVLLNAPGLAAAAVVRHLATNLQVYGHE